jgi:hypothetical protein
LNYFSRTILLVTPTRKMENNSNTTIVMQQQEQQQKEQQQKEQQQQEQAGTVSAEAEVAGAVAVEVACEAVAGAVAVEVACEAVAGAVAVEVACEAVAGAAAAKSKRAPNRSKAEIEKAKEDKKKAQAEKAEKAQARAQATEARLKAKRELAAAPVEQLLPGIGLDARAAMLIFDKCRGKANNAFRRMIMMRKIFNPAENINKFMTGGGAEEVVHQLISSAGFACKNVSAKATVIDLEVMVPISANVADTSAADAGAESLYRFAPSLKNSGNIKMSPILENYRGKKRDDIRPLPPTLIIYTEVALKRVRIVYLDHEIIRQGFPTLSDEERNSLIFKNEDSNLTFQSGFLNKFIPRLPTEYILNADYPEDLPTGEEKNIVLLALAEVDRQLALAASA